MSPSTSSVRSRGSAHVLIPAAVAAIALLAGALRLSTGGLEPTAEVALVMPGDTVVIHGPRRYDAFLGDTAFPIIMTHVDTIPVTVIPMRRYVVRVKNGEPNGTQRVQFAAIAGEQLTGAMASLSFEIAVKSTVLLDLSIQDQPDSGHLTVELLEIDGGNFAIFGTERFSRVNNNSDVTFTRTITRGPNAGAPFFLWLVNGNANGTQRLSGVTVRVNNDTVIGSVMWACAPPGNWCHPPVLTTGTALLMVPVALNPGANTLFIKLPKKQAGFVDISVMATDITPPTLTILAPPVGLVTQDTIITARARVVDPAPASPVAMTVNGLVASSTADTFTVQVPLAEGLNTLTFRAVDAAGAHTDSTRIVRRDRTPPLLTVDAPLNGSITNQTAVTVSGSVLDATRVTVNANGTPLPVDGAGAFTGSVPLVEGLNSIVVTATDTVGNTSLDARTVRRDTQAPVLTVTAPLDGATISTPSVLVEGTASDDSTGVRDVTVNGTQVTLTNGAFSHEVALAVGANTITVIATDSATNAETVTRSVTRGTTLPPDPSTVATEIDPSVPTNLATTTAFLYTGANPIQTGVTAGTISPIRAAVLRGKVMSRAGDPLLGVTISVVGHPEFGQTLSREDGMFDMAVNGGGRLTVNYEKAGLLPAQRTVDAHWQDFTLIDDVAMIEVDPVVTTINFAQPIEVARGSVVHDTDGTRQATMLFPQGTTATMVFPNGTMQQLSSIQVRATEYSIAGTGRQAMPAELPPTSAYTYAVEFSVDEAIDAGAKSVTFSQPVPTYVENFLQFPIGLRVPAGYYDRQEARWVGAPNGRIVKILSETSGRANLDVTGSGQVSSPAELAALGITDAERDQLAQLYDPSQSFWRVPVTHFSPWDYNWPYTAGPGASPPPGDGPRQDGSPDDPDCQAGSIIDCQSQVLREVVPVTGTFPITYQSSRAPGYKAGRTLTIPLIGPTVPTGLKRIQLSILVAGRRFNQNFQPVPNQVGYFTWDGRDAYDRPVPGVVTARIGLSYLYRAVYTEPAAFQQSFAMPSDVVITAVGGGGGGGGSGSGLVIRGIPDTADQGIYVSRVFERQLGPWQPASLAGLGGWTFTVHHTYDPVNQVIHQGDGTQRSARNIGLVIQTIAGSGSDGFFEELGDSVPARQGIIGSPVGVAVAADGSIYVADRLWSLVRRIRPDGLMVTVAGSGRNGGYGGDNGPATSALLGSPTGVAVAPDGSLYIADMGNQRVRRVDPQGIITTVAGTGQFGFDQDGIAATSAKLFNPVSVAVAPDGGLYIADQGNHRIRRVDPSGIIQTVAGDGTPCFLGQLPESEFANICKDNGRAIAAKLRNPTSVAVASDGTLFIGDGLNRRVRRVSLSGIITTVAGNGGTPGTGDGGPATGAGLVVSPEIALGSDGSIYISQAQGSVSEEVNAIRRVAPNGIITTVAGMGTAGFSGDGGPSLQARIANPEGVAVAPDGALLISDLDNHRVRRVGPALPGLGLGDVLLASSDGAQVYLFDQRGRHLQTLGTSMHDTLYQFAYDTADRLTRVVDRNKDTTRVLRDGTGAPTSIVAPYGQTTVLSVDTSGYLDSIANPMGHAFRPAYDSVGLLSTFTDPKGQKSTFRYDSLGRLQSDSNAAGGVVRLAKTRTDSVSETTVQSPEGRITTYRIEPTSSAGIRRSVIDAAGLTTSFLRDPAGQMTIVAPTGDSMMIAPHPDPVWGMLAALPDSASLRVPSGLKMSVRGGRQITLSNPNDPLSVVAVVDSVGINGRWSVKRFSSASREVTQTSPEGRSFRARLDSVGRVVAAQASDFDSMTYSYDTRGRLSAQHVGGRTWTYNYDNRGRLFWISDPLGRRDSLFYDDGDRLVRRVLPGGRVVQFGYDPNGNLTSLTAPGRPAHGFQYTALDQIGQFDPPQVTGPKPTRYFYNRDRQVDSIVRPDSTTVAFGYDASGRPSTVTFDRGTLSLGYSPTSGNVIGMRAPTGDSLTFSYDGTLPTEERWVGAVNGRVGVQYDTDFHVVMQTVNGVNPVNFTYDRDGLVLSSGAVRLGRSETSGQLLADTIGSVSGAYSYTSQGALEGSRFDINGTALFANAYLRDSLRRIVRRIDTAEGVPSRWSFVYDSSGRLIIDSLNGIVLHAFTYDSNGNRLAFTSANGTINYTYDDQDRLLQAGTTSFTYGSNGKLKTKSVVGVGTTTYTYDAPGNLMTVLVPDGTRIDYLVDGKNRRIGRKVNGALVKGWLYQNDLNVVAELDGNSNVVSRFVYASRPNVPDYVIKNGVAYRIISDLLGSVRRVVDTNTGNVVQRIDYDEWGNVTQNTNPGFQPFGFGGGLYDELTGFVRFGARDYQPDVGRWTAKDPIGFSGGDPNLYGYVFGDPINNLDPTGLDFWITWHAVGPYSHAMIWWQYGDTFDPSRYHRTFGAGPEFWPNCSGGELFGCLNADYNRPNDANKEKQGWVKLTLPCGVSELEMLNRLNQLQDYYMENWNGKIGYTPLPVLPTSYNSNSYAHGLANAAGFGAPASLPGSPNTPGWGNPVPDRFFGP